MKKSLSCLLVFLFVLDGWVQGQTGLVDSSFGTNGALKANLGFSYIENKSLVTQSDGKILVLARSVYAGKDKAVIIRYLGNGTLDNSFGTNGIQILFGTDTTTISGNQMHVQPDGKIVVCGKILKEHTKPFVARLNTNGSFDNDFNGNGLVVINTAGVETCEDVVVLPNNKMIAFTASTDIYTAPPLSLTCLEADGSINNSFGTNGRAAVNVAEFMFQSVAMQTDGKFVLIGFSHGLVAIRIKSTGTVDSTFANNGLYRIADAIDYEPTYALGNVLVQTDGKILLGNYTNRIRNLSSTRLTKLLPDGTLDNSFNGAGTLYLQTTNGYCLLGRMALQTDGKILMAGYVGSLQNPDFALARINSNGSMDASFDGDGYATLALGNQADYGLAPFVQTDGKILVLGTTSNGGREELALARFLQTGAADNSFGISGKVTAYIGSTPDVDLPLATYIQPDQKIICLHQYSAGTSVSLLVTRHLTNGSLDSSFGVDGKSYFLLPVKISMAAVHRASNGKLLIAFGSLAKFDGYKNFLLRLNVDGTVDTGFGTGGLVTITPIRSDDYLLDLTIDTTTGKTHLLIRADAADVYNEDSVWVVRLTTDGAFDNTFNGNGKLLLDFVGIGLGLQADGKIVCVGEPDYHDSFSFAVRRYHVNGTADASFNNGSKLVVPNPPNFNTPFMVTVLPNNKLLFPVGDGLIKLKANGTFDSSFAHNGILTWGANDGYYYYSQTDTLERTLFIGLGKYDPLVPYAPERLLRRLKPNGTNDSTFATNGEMRLAADTTGIEGWTKVGLQADGKILVTGILDRSTNNDFWQDDYDRLYAPMDFVMRRFNSSPSGGRYTFTGNGNWNIPSNWSNNMMPPLSLPSGSEIIIDPASGACILNVPVTIQTGGKITVKTGKNFVVQGNLTVQ